MSIRKYSVFLCAAVLSVGVLAGCGETDVTESTVELKKDGKVIEYTIEDFSESYYDSDELASYIDSEVEAWTSENEGTVKVKKSEVEEQTAYLTIQYDTTDTFSDFNGIECFSGSVVQAQSAGYDFDVDFIAAASDEDSSAGEADEDVSAESDIETANPQTLLSKEDVIGDDELNVLIIRDHVDIIVPGTIAYVSAEYTEISADNTVSVSVPEDAADQDVLVYVLYK